MQEKRFIQEASNLRGESRHFSLKTAFLDLQVSKGTVKREQRIGEVREDNGSSDGWVCGF